ncbi:DUF3021 domain-containing protein [Apilactobacillus nanyangensis]|uniref:DUF3021 domain-containing protein n=1 Tax=Apilactobacillus nanyangensis TaxID=2799579 RepID=A0ABT0I031_9LACO|nr:DUF3021 family protein [Apilactobacillus nanyangensis]MCK8611919.1 DUF3021 domain-containing protein [Apilactobacillus nanyangensis]
MNLCWSLFKRFFIGMLIGSFLYVVTGVYINNSSYNISDRLIFLFASGLIGLLSVIFKSEKIGIVWEFIIHGVLSYIIVVALNLVITPYFDFWNPKIFTTFTFEFLVIYVIICTSSIVTFHRSTKEINDEITKRKQKMNQKNN